MQKLLWTLAIQCFVIYPGFSQSVSGNGQVVKQERTVEPFSKLNTRSGWDVLITAGNTYELVVETDENLLEVVKTEVRSGELFIYSDTQIRKSKKRVVHLTVKELEEISASGGADIKGTNTLTSDRLVIQCSGGSDLHLPGIHTGDFKATLSGGSDAKVTLQGSGSVVINAAGGSDVNLRDISGEECNLDLSGGSDAVLSGDVNQLTIQASGGSDIEGDELDVKTASIHLSGSSDAKLTVANELRMILSGGSDLTCYGNPRILQQNVCKSCDVRIQ